MSRTYCALSLVLLCAVVANCSGSGGDDVAAKPSGPVTAIEAFLMAGNERNYSKAEA